MLMINYQELTDAVSELEEEKVLEMLNTFVSEKPTEAEALQAVEACQKGMVVVGDLFEREDYFVGDLIFAGEMLTSAIDILSPVLGSADRDKVGKILLGTVSGDLHDIGKNIFKGMAEAAGFEVYDMGIDVADQLFVEKAKELQPDIIGMSGVLTLALESMKNVVTALSDEGIRDKYKIIIGGNPVTKEASEQIGADAFTINAAEGVKICQEWVN